MIIRRGCGKFSKTLQLPFSFRFYFIRQVGCFQSFAQYCAPRLFAASSSPSSFEWPSSAGARCNRAAICPFRLRFTRNLRTQLNDLQLRAIGMRNRVARRRSASSIFLPCSTPRFRIEPESKQADRLHRPKHRYANFPEAHPAAAPAPPGPWPEHFGFVASILRIRYVHVREDLHHRAQVGISCFFDYSNSFRSGDDVQGFAMRSMRLIM